MAGKAYTADSSNNPTTLQLFTITPQTLGSIVHSDASLSPLNVRIISITTFAMDETLATLDQAFEEFGLDAETRPSKRLGSGDPKLSQTSSITTQPENAQNTSPKDAQAPPLSADYIRSLVPSDGITPRDFVNQINITPKPSVSELKAASVGVVVFAAGRLHLKEHASAGQAMTGYSDRPPTSVSYTGLQSHIQLHQQNHYLRSQLGTFAGLCHRQQHELGELRKRVDQLNGSVQTTPGGEAVTSINGMPSMSLNPGSDDPVEIRVTLTIHQAPRTQDSVPDSGTPPEARTPLRTNTVMIPIKGALSMWRLFRSILKHVEPEAISLLTRGRTSSPEPWSLGFPATVASSMIRLGVNTGTDSGVAEFMDMSMARTRWEYWNWLGGHIGRVDKEGLSVEIKISL